MSALAAEGHSSCAGKTELPQGLKPARYERVTARLKPCPFKDVGIAGAGGVGQDRRPGLEIGEGHCHLISRFGSYQGMTLVMPKGVRTGQGFGPCKRSSGAKARVLGWLKGTAEAVP